MTNAGDILITVDDKLSEHIQRQVGAAGQSMTASDYVRELIQRDLEDQNELREWYDTHLRNAAESSDSKFIAVSAADVIRRNQQQ